MDPITLQQVLDALTTESGDAAALLSGEAGQGTDLAALEAQATEAFDALREGDIGDDEIAQLQTLTDAILAIRTEQTSRQEAAAETLARVDEMAAQIAPAVADVDDVDGDGDGGDVAGDDVQTAQTAVGDGGDQGAVSEVEGAVGDAGGPAEEQVAASAQQRRQRARVDLGRVAARRRTDPQPPPADRAAAQPQLRAAAELPGVAAGHVFGSVLEMAEAASRRFVSMPRTQGAPRVQNGIAVIAKEYPEELVAAGGTNDMDIIDHAANEHRLPNGSLVAAGGWCAPSEVMYDLVELEGTDGLVDVPEIVAARGGVRWTPGPDFSAIFSSTGFIQTEAQAQAQTDKPCFEVPCPNFDEVRLDAIGVCLQAGILQQRAYPEAVARFIRGALKAHAHRYSGTTIARMASGSTAVTLTGDLGATVTVLDAIELQATDYRTRHRMADRATLEIIAPRWLRGVIRTDLAARNGVERESVTNSQIDGWLRDRQVNAQWVYNWQDAYFTGTIGGAVPPTAWPAQVQVLMYAAGTWVRATSDIIQLDAVYDSVLFRKNQYNALFMEEGLAVMKRGHDSRLLTIPICPSGATGAQVLVDCTPTP